MLVVQQLSNEGVVYAVNVTESLCDFFEDHRGWHDTERQAAERVEAKRSIESTQPRTLLMELDMPKTVLHVSGADTR